MTLEVSPLLIDMDIGDDSDVSMEFSDAILVRDEPIETYTGDYVVIPLADEAVVLDTNGKMMTDDVTVQQVPYFETTNPTGKTVYIASEVI